MPWDPGITNFFTDGSKFEFGTGAAYIVFSHIHRSQDYIHLGEHATVFQAEITAINMAALDLLEVEMSNHNIHFHIDSQGAMKSLEAFFTKHKCVAECKRLLNKLTEYNNKVYLNWIPGHTGQLGNGIADNLAVEKSPYGSFHIFRSPSYPSLNDKAVRLSFVLIPPNILLHKVKLEDTLFILISLHYTKTFYILI